MWVCYVLGSPASHHKNESENVPRDVQVFEHSKVSSFVCYTNIIWTQWLVCSSYETRRNKKKKCTTKTQKEDKVGQNNPSRKQAEQSVPGITISVFCWLSLWSKDVFCVERQHSHLKQPSGTKSHWLNPLKNRSRLKVVNLHLVF